MAIGILRADDAHNDLRLATGSLSGWLVGLAMPAIRYIRSRLTEWLPDLRRWGGTREKGRARPKQAGLFTPRLDGTRGKVDPACSRDGRTRDVQLGKLGSALADLALKACVCSILA